MAQCYLGKSFAVKSNSSLGEDKAFKAYEILKDSESPTNRYKFAQVCIKLGKFYDAEIALMGAKVSELKHLKYNYQNLE